MMFDMGHDDDGINVLIDYTQTVSLVRMVGNALTPARLVIKAEVLPSMNAGEIDFDVSFAKIKFWFETVVSRTIVFCRANTLALNMFTDKDGKSQIVNHLMISPHEPTDEHLGALFQAKMTALSNNTMNFGAVRVNSDSSSGLVWSYVGDWEEDLPTMSDWFDTKPYYFDKPWWCRADISTLDMIPAGASDFSTPPPWAFGLEFIEQAIRPTAADKDDGPESPENVVIRGAFRPRVIDGDAEGQP